MGIFDRLFGKSDPKKSEPNQPSNPVPSEENKPANQAKAPPAPPEPQNATPNYYHLEPTVGMKLKDRYRIEKELGRGGVGVVFKAVDEHVHNRPVVIKVLLDGPDSNEWLNKKFHHESEALSRIDDPGVVKVLDTGFLPNQKQFFVMEYINGVMLRNRMVPGGMAVADVARIIRQLGQALDSAHSAEVFHRDLKPENIMLQALQNGGEQAKLIDFGIAKVKNPTADSSTVGPITAGTFYYMAPEQLERGETSAASDIFSLGVIIYEMLTSQRPFNPQSENQFALMNELWRLQRVGVRDQLRTLRPDLSKSAQACLLKGLAFNPQDRPATAGAFCEELSQLLLGQKITHPVPKIDHNAVTVVDDDEPPVVSNKPTPIQTLQTPRSSEILAKLEPVGGAVALDSPFYVERLTDVEFHEAVSRHDSIILIKGARQMGKTSLMARGMQQARKTGTRVVITDFQELSEESLKTPDEFFLTVAELMADQLELEVFPREVWKTKSGPSVNFKRYIQKEVLEKLSTPLVWGMDEADRLFTTHFHSEVFGLFRSWHNARALDPTAPWHRLTMVIAYATEAHLFITDVNQSPFNVGTRLELKDFTLDHITDLNQRYGLPLKNELEIHRFFNQVGGQPYLIRRGLHEMVSHQLSIESFENQASRDDGPMGDHLGRVLQLVNKDANVRETVKLVLQKQPCQNPEHFYRLRSAGIMAGESVADMRPRCQIYATYLARHLL